VGACSCVLRSHVVLPLVRGCLHVWRSTLRRLLHSQHLKHTTRDCCSGPCPLGAKWDGPRTRCANLLVSQCSPVIPYIRPTTPRDMQPTPGQPSQGCTQYCFKGWALLGVTASCCSFVVHINPPARRRMQAWAGTNGNSPPQLR
jgi:hypothetical protein